MTFVFDGFSGSLFFVSMGLMFLILLNRDEKTDKVVGECPLHPGVKDCIHRR